MTPMNKLWLKFALTQLVNVPLALIGLVVCLSPTVAMASWLWWNDDDGSGPGTTWWSKYYWLAIRNPVDNLKHVERPFVVATPGGPLAYKTWTWFGKQWYYKIGYMPHEGYPACSAGAGRGY
jgi:hypothetical protein